MTPSLALTRYGVLAPSSREEPARVSGWDMVCAETDKSDGGVIMGNPEVQLMAGTINE